MTAAHTNAHIQVAVGDVVEVHHDDHHQDGGEFTDILGDESPVHDDHSDDPNEHGHELHVTAIDAAALSALPTTRPLSFDAAYKDKKFPALKTPSDPFPDRA